MLIAQHVRLTASWLGAVLRSPRYRKEEARAYERAKELLTYMGLWEVRGEISSSLPYGMQRKLEIAAPWRRSRRCCCWTNPRRA